MINQLFNLDICHKTTQQLFQSGSSSKDGEMSERIGARRALSASGDKGSADDLTPDHLVRQNYELRHRLEEESSSYKRRLDTYRQAQQHQAALVSRLQAKASYINTMLHKNSYNVIFSQVLQYKQRCSELENQMAESIPMDNGKILASSFQGSTALESAHQTLREMREEQVSDLDTALKKIADDRRRLLKKSFVFFIYNYETKNNNFISSGVKNCWRLTTR